MTLAPLPQTPGAEIADDNPVAPWLDDPEGVSAALRRGRTRDLEARLDDTPALLSLIHAERLAAAVIASDGSEIFANNVWRRLFGGDQDRPPGPDAVREAVHQVMRTGQSAAHFAAAPAPDGARPVFVAAPAALARRWALPAAARAAAETPAAAVVVLAVSAFSVAEALHDAAHAYGLTDLQSRIAVGLVRTGDVRGAAREAGVTYLTARTVAAQMLKRTGTPRLSALIGRLVRLAYGVPALGREGEAVLGDVWGLTERQAELALRIAQGLSRAEAARAGGMSEAAAKKQLEIVFAALEVSSAAALARRVAEARALALLTDVSGSSALPRIDCIEPLRLFARPQGGEIAYSDYGPQSGVPVLVLHSSTQSRHVPFALVRALQQAGFRPLALDRPGFGFTDLPPDAGAWRADPFSAAVADIESLCDRLRLARLDIVARGGAQVALALARLAPHRISRMVLVNPDPPTDARGHRGGPLGAVRDMFARFPRLIERLAWTLARRTDDVSMRRIVMRSVHLSPPDVALMQDDEAFADYARGFRLFATGRVAGYVAEQTALTRWSSAPMPGLAGWRILVSEHDPLHDPAHVRAWWQATLPDTPMHTVPGTGRFLVMQRPDLIAATLNTPT